MKNYISLYLSRPAVFVLLAALCWLAVPLRVGAQIKINGWGLRTSVPAWFVLSPSIGADISWNQRYRLALDASYGHGDAPKNDDKGVHLSSVGIEVRRYMKPVAYSGFYLGADVRRLEFNYKLSSIGRDGWAITAGILAGYTFKLPASWGIDVSAGCGYIHSDYTRYRWYEPQKMNRFLNNRIRNTVGLTNLNVALHYGFCL